MKIKLNILYLFLAILTHSCVGQISTDNKSINNKPLQLKMLDLVAQLDSASKIDTSLHIGGESKNYTLFKQISDISTDNELFYLIENHDNAIIKGYAYMALKVHENTDADTFYMKHFKRLEVCVYDMCTIYSDKFSKECINDMKPKINRIKNILKLKGKTKFIDEEEEKVIKEENKIREEQGMPLLEDPK